MNRKEMHDEILTMVGEYCDRFHNREQPYKEGERIPYASRVYDREEMMNLVDSALEFWLTSGRYVKEFEKGLAEYLGIKYTAVVNSGSSANLLAFMTLTSPLLTERRICPGDEVITVAAGFPTTVSPIINYGAVPVFVDVTIPQYNIDVTELETALSEKTKAVMIAHTLGNPFDLQTVKSFCDRHGLWLVEDNCDALGSLCTIDGEKKFTGTIGDLGTSSFYPPHHMTMGQGGAVYTEDPLLNKIMRSFRDWGRDCVCPSGQDNFCGHRFDGQYGELPKGYDHKYVYSHFGLNLNITDMQAAVGVAQLKKLNSFTKERRRNFSYLRKALKGLEKYFILPEACENSKPSWFGFSLTCREGVDREKLVRYLEKKGVQTRMLFAGNLIKHPCFDEMRRSGQGYRVVGSLENTDRIMRDTFWVGVYPGMTDEKLDYMAYRIQKGAKKASKGLKKIMEGPSDQSTNKTEEAKTVKKKDIVDEIANPMKQLAICIPTYNRADIVDELLARLGASYFELGWDVYIYDSSTAVDTAKVVKKYQEIFSNINYIYLDSSIHSNLKVYTIFQTFAYMKKYKYVWVMSDSIRWSKRILPEIKEHLNELHDLLVVSYLGGDENIPKKYEDKISLFSDLGWYMTLYGSTILNTETMLSSVDWEYCTRKYCMPDTINFSHLCLYFEQMSKMEKIDAVYMPFSPHDFASSPLKEFSGWFNDAFKILCEAWPKSIYSLPSCYENVKEKVIKDQMKSGMFSKIFFLQTRWKGSLDLFTYIKYMGRWKRFTDVPESEIFRISITPRDTVFKRLNKGSIWVIKGKEIKEFCRKYPKTYIYGCGGNSKPLAEFLESNGIEYQGFLVSSVKEEKSVFRGHKVIEFRKELFGDPEVGIINTLNKKNYAEVIGNFEGNMERIWAGTV